MAQADLLVTLLKSGNSGDQTTFRQAADALIQEEKSKGHRILADRLTKAVREEKPFFTHNRLLKGNGGNGQCRDLLYEKAPERKLSSLMLPAHVEKQIREVVEEQHRAELLHAHNLCARNRLLFAGPPGNGKTTLAEALAYELMYPLVVVRYETLIGSYLGETSTRLKHLLDYTRMQKCVLFFDEFETLGKERGDTRETGEIKRVVSSLLLQIDDLPDYVVVIAASNHPELLDRAVWRRFQVQVDLPAPSKQQMSAYINLLQRRHRVNLGYSMETLTKHMRGLSFSEVEEFCLSVVRLATLKRQANNAREITRSKLEQWQPRLKPSTSRRVKR